MVKYNKVSCCISLEVGALITAILVMLEGVALISGSILFLVLQFRVLDATHVICFYFLIVFIVTPFAIFVIFSASLSVYGVKKRNYVYIQPALIAIGLMILVTLLSLYKIILVDDFKDEQNAKIFVITLCILNIYLFAIDLMVFDEFYSESKGLVAPRKLSEDDLAIYEF